MRKSSLCLQVEQEKNAVHNEKSDVEQDKSTLRQVKIASLESLEFGIHCYLSGIGQSRTGKDRCRE